MFFLLGDARRPVIEAIQQVAELFDTNILGFLVPRSSCNAMQFS